MGAHAIDAAVATVAARQHGVFHRKQASAVGATAKMVRLRVRSRRWLVLAPDVFALPGNPPTLWRQLKAAELSVTGSALAGRHAAGLHDLEGARLGTVRLLAPRNAKRTSPLAVVHRTTRPIETTTVRNIRVLTVAATIVDLAGTVPLGVLERVVDSALVQQKVTIDDLAGRHADMRRSRTPGSAALGLLVEDRLTGYVPPTNELERAAALLLDDPRIPPYEVQVVFDWWPAAPMRVDFYIPLWRRIIEVDGRLWHSRFADFERDRWRDHQAQMHGVEVSRFTYRQVVHEPDYVLGVLLGVGQHAG